MKNYLNTLISEKGLNLESIIEVKGSSGTNFIPLAVVVEHILITSETEKKQIKNTLVKIDFHNGDIMHFFTYLAQAIAK
tara:strand:- start:2765 stop:3001 length:237 start_codon:yes stop_codon:yes gene_type:complete